MKIPNKRGLQQIATNHSSKFDFRDNINLYKNVLENHIPFRRLTLLLHQKILYVLERIFYKECKN